MYSITVSPTYAGRRRPPVTITAVSSITETTTSTLVSTIRETVVQTFLTTLTGMKYILPGEDFYSVGLMHSYGENPIYIIRTFPEKLLLPNGRHAFPKWEGGILAVAARQLEDFNTFMKTWLELR